MIKSLSIENFALIDQLAIQFKSGFTTITGETGAGKSILLGALGLVLGQRADVSAVKDKNKKCIVEAVFHIGDYQLAAFFNEVGMDFDPETIIRREILPGGKSRAFVNDSPVHVQDLQRLGDMLIDIHSQHETRDLSNSQVQLRIIDGYASNASLLTEYQQQLALYKTSQSDLKLLQEQLAALLKEQDYHAFLHEELVAAQIVPGEIAALEDEINALANVETLRTYFDKALTVAQNEEYGVLSNLRTYKAALQKTASIAGSCNSLSERLSSVLVEVSDITLELERLADKLVANPVRLEEATARLHVLAGLLKKHQVNTEDDLVLLRETLGQNMRSLTELADKIDSLANRINQMAITLDSLSNQLHDNRLKASPNFINELTDILARLGMPFARFEITLEPLETYGNFGKETVVIKFSANKGADFGLLSKVASGGELSRIMLAVKSVLARFYQLPTLIFDEIDTGVSGEIAAGMAQVMAGMSANMQLFAITHLPQIAAKGNQQYKVFKQVDGDQTSTNINELDNQMRVMEIARMLSGELVTDSAIAHAEALLT